MASEKDIKILVGERIYQLRKGNGLSQDELAERAGIDRTYIGPIENGKQNPSLEVLFKISTALNVSISDLFRFPGDGIEKVEEAAVLYEVKEEVKLKEHEDIEAINKLFPSIREFQKLASKHGIADVFQDNGGKLLQVLLVTGLQNLSGREGNDAIDEIKNEYELKSVNVSLTKSFSTHHHLNPGILKKYRQVVWIFAIYEGIELQSIYSMKPQQLEPYFTAWGKKWEATGDINNPKIPVNFVIKEGKQLFTKSDGSLTRIKLNS